MAVRVRSLGWPVASLLSVVGVAASGGDLRLLDAVKNKDQNAARSLLAQHVDVNATEGDGATALAWAAHWDDLETVDLLIRAGANVNAADDLGGTPLSQACTNRSAAMAERLLKAGANAKAAQKTGETALMTCARTGSAEAVKSLLAHGADVNAREIRLGQTALMWSATEKHPDVTRVLIEHGADANARSKSGFTPLLFAARSGDVDSARALVGAGADVNAAATNGMTPLLMASASGHEAISIFLAEQGANPKAADRNGITPLHFALQKGISVLRSAGSDEPHTYAFLYRPPMRELVQALLKDGADPNARIVDLPSELEGSNHISWLGGATPFLLAAATVDVDSMRALAAAGADVRLRTGNGMTALMLVAGLGADAKSVKPDMEKDAMAAVKLTVELGSDVNVSDVDGETPLQLAASKGVDPIVRYLVERGANVNAKDSTGQTALHSAAFKGADTIVQFLVEKGANVNAKDKSGQTPLDVAEGMLQPGQLGKGQVSILILLQSKKVNKSTADLLRTLGGEHGDNTGGTASAPSDKMPGKDQ